MGAAASRTLLEALSEFRRMNGLSEDEAMSTCWNCRIGPVMVRLPNFRWRQHAILAHDLHHVLTGYPCTLCGEFQMAAWEFGAGRMPHWAARLFCLPLVLVGLLWSPRRILAAFLVGGRSHSLHETKSIGHLLATPLCVVRAQCSVAPNLPARRAEYVRFVLLIMEAIFISLSPLAIVVGLWISPAIL